MAPFTSIKREYCLVVGIQLSGIVIFYFNFSLNKNKVKLDLLTDIGMLLIVEKGIRGGICHAIHRYTKANNKYMKDYDKTKDSSYLKSWDVNNLYRWAMPQKLPINGFKWVEKTSQFNNGFIKNYNEDSDIGYFFLS